MVEGIGGRRSVVHVHAGADAEAGLAVAPAMATALVLALADGVGRSSAAGRGPNGAQGLGRLPERRSCAEPMGMSLVLLLFLLLLLVADALLRRRPAMAQEMHIFWSGQVAVMYAEYLDKER